MTQVLGDDLVPARAHPGGQAQVLGQLAALLRATSTWPWWLGSTLALALAGAGAGLHSPTTGGDFWHLANAEVISRLGLGAPAAYLTHGGAALDLRSWLSDLLLLGIDRAGGLPGLAAAGAVLGSLLGLAMAALMRRGRFAHPLLALLAGGLALLALRAALPDWPSEVLALLALGLLACLAAIQRGSRWGSWAVVGLLVLWSNSQADAAVAMLVVWVWLALARQDAGRQGQPRPSWWLVPLTLLAVLASPRGLGTLWDLRLSLGMGNEYPLLASWSSLDFHLWGTRLAELCGLLLLGGYWLAGSRLARADAFLGLLTAALTLVWANYLPWFLVVAGVQGAICLAAGLDRLPAPSPSLACRSGLRRRLTGLRGPLAVGLPALLGVALLAVGVAGARAGGGPGPAARAQLPVQAATWLADHRVGGTWYAPPLFGDYLAWRFPAGRHLTCLDDPVPLAGRGLQRCTDLAILNSGAMTVLGRLRVSLAVVPPAAPQAAFLLEEGWKIRYRDSATLILSPRNL
ncbi:MAG: hypothetical protein ACREOD_05345 [Candidatus Dormibacteria bacterium]